MSDESSNKPEAVKPLAWHEIYGMPCLVQGSGQEEVHIVIYTTSKSGDGQSFRPMKPDHPIAQLIKSAPELLAALQGLLADDYQNATAAMANELETEAEGALIEQREAAARAAISQATEAKGPA